MLNEVYSFDIIVPGATATGKTLVRPVISISVQGYPKLDQCLGSFFLLGQLYLLNGPLDQKAG